MATEIDILTQLRCPDCDQLVVKSPDPELSYQCANNKCRSPIRYSKDAVIVL